MRWEARCGENEPNKVRSMGRFRRSMATVMLSGVTIIIYRALTFASPSNSERAVYAAVIFMIG